MVQNARVPRDLNHVYDLTLTLIQHGANPNVNIVAHNSTGASGDDYYNYKAHDDEYSQHYYHHHHRSSSAGCTFVLYQFVQVFVLVLI